MKKLNYKFILFFSLIALFASCGSSSSDNKSDYNFTGTCKSTIPLNGFAGQETKTSNAVSSSSLDKMLSDYDYSPPITKGVFLTNTTSVEINGLKEGVVLQNFSLNMNGLEHNFGNITYNDTILCTNQTMNYFKNVFDKMMQQQNLITYATFTPNITIDEKSGVKLNIALGGAFTYWK